jgi:uncharacterized protein YndB with AHSA1/START domain
MTKSKQVVLERTLNASIEDVWALWTTPEGIESWWGPEGFTVKVSKLELRPGGQLVYAMIATGPEQIAFMKQAGMPLATETRIVYDEIVAPRRLKYTNVIDFVPGVEAYENGTLVELHAAATGVRMVLTLDAMHDETWTQRAVMGWQSELGKLAALLASRPGEKLAK